MGELLLDDNWQLFIDDHAIARSTGFDRVVHHPRAMGVVIPADKPWETKGLEVYFTDRLKNGTFVAHYLAMWWNSKLEVPGSDTAHKISSGLGYATSEDGIHWNKPNLGLVDAPSEIDWSKSPFPDAKGSSRDNNLGIPFEIVMDLGRFGNVSDPAKKYAIRLAAPIGQGVAAYWEDKPKGYFASQIPDFINDPCWANKLTEAGSNFNPRRKSLHFWDDIHTEWVAMEQGVIGHWLPSREIGRMASKDLLRWTGESVLYPDALDPHTQEQYDEPMFLIPFCADGIVFGMLSWFHGDRTHPHGGPNLTDPTKHPGHPDHWPFCRKGSNDMRITISRDGGKTWDRTSSRTAWIPCGTEEDAYDRCVIGPIGMTPVRVGDEDWFYINVIEGDHLGICNNPEQSIYYYNRMAKTQTALYIQKHHRYVSLTAKNYDEILITKPLKLCGTSLQLNVNAARGKVSVAIASAEPVAAYNGTALLNAAHLSEKAILNGFGFEQCQPVYADSVEHTVNFQNADIKSLQDKTVRLLFKMNNADLYGFRMV